MKSLKTLIRLQKQRVDELKRKMVELEKKKFALIDRGEALALELVRELELASQQVEMSGFFGEFAERIRNQRNELAEEVKKIDVYIHDLQELIRDAYGELKKFEVAEEHRKERVRQEAATRESKELDEIAISQYARKEKVDDR